MLTDGKDSRAIEQGYAEAWRCPICKSELFDDCDRAKHPATLESFAAYMSRSQRIYVMRLRALGVTP